MISKQKIAQEAKKEAISELEDLYAKKDSLEAEIGLLTSDFGREKAFREKFGVVHEGEDVIVLVEDGEDIYEGDDATFFEKIFGALGKLFVGE
jgi:cell division protein FtsB